ncbi:hypothetical protein Z042_15540 [Chania multitudinisentens RB-25]|uniref:DUF3592 domain-containing protein n=1 Tax=Chania multitudinisentens RB-25 TaxID=1441930 RepID=W0LK98_9GAMM|nr:hypothetical protein [Chania multitudinisentens]AHG22849.1 hypothetical protein Z042_15540 [Chania multitudinisentens RB-25]
MTNLLDFIIAMTKHSIWAYPIIAIIIVLLLYYLFTFIKSNKLELNRARGEKQAMNHGVEAWAKVVRSSLTAGKSNLLFDGKRSLDLELEILPQNASPFTVTTTILADPLTLDDYRSGSEVTVKYIPENKNNIVVYKTLRTPTKNAI